MSRFIVAIDQGTTGSTVLVFDENLALRGRGYREFQQHYPEPGWVEHEPEEIWQTVLGALAEAFHYTGSTSSLPGRRHRHHQPARDHAGLGSRDRAADAPRHRLAGPPHRRRLRRARRPPARSRRPRAHRPGARPVLLRHQAARGCSTTSPARARAPSAASSPSAPSTASWSGG